MYKVLDSNRNLMRTHISVQEFDRSALQATSDATLTTKATKLWTPATAAA